MPGADRGPVVAVRDYLRTVPDLIRASGPRRYVVLGTDGYGRSDTRAALRRFFEVDRHHIALAALKALADDGALERSRVGEAIARYGIDAGGANSWDCCAAVEPRRRRGSASCLQRGLDWPNLTEVDQSVWNLYAKRFRPRR
jgi:hypothetical protein